jgi:hypothetical protein
MVLHLPKHGSAFCKEKMYQKGIENTIPVLPIVLVLEHKNILRKKELPST